MTNAYVEGFCKVAEAHGVDPVELMKTAGLFSGLFSTTQKNPPIHQTNGGVPKVVSDLNLGKNDIPDYRTPNPGAHGTWFPATAKKMNSMDDVRDALREYNTFTTDRRTGKPRYPVDTPSTPEDRAYAKAHVNALSNMARKHNATGATFNQLIPGYHADMNAGTNYTTRVSN